MKEIEQLYYNDFGVAFHWIKNDEVLRDRVQLVFKETGFYLSAKEIKEFTALINVTCNEARCNGCSLRSHCHKFLLKTPLKEVDLAVSHKELLCIKDLMEGTLFYLNLQDYIKVCRN